MKTKKKPKKRSFTRAKALLQELAREHKRAIILLSIGSIIIALGNALIPLIMGRFLDAIIAPSDISFGGFHAPVWLVLLIAWAGVKFISHSLQWFVDLRGDRLMESVWVQYVLRAFKRIILFPVSFHKKNTSGGVIQKVYRAVGALRGLFVQLVTNLAAQFLTVLVAAVVMVMVQPILAAIILIGVIFYIVFLLFRSKESSRLHKQSYRHNVNAYSTTTDAIHNVHMVKRAATEQYEIGQMRRVFQKALDTDFAIHRLWGGLRYWQDIVIVSTQVIIFSLSLFFIFRGDMTVGTLVAFTGYANLAFRPFVAMSRIWQRVQDTFITLEKTEKMLATKPETYEPHNAHPMRNIHGHISIQNVSFWYEKKSPVLRNINLDIPAGKTLALVGESGVGKSTFVDLLTALHLPTKGKILIDGVDIRKIPLNDLRSHIAVVPQEPNLFNDRIDVNIKYGTFRAAHDEVVEASRKAHAFEFIEKFPKKWRQVVGERGYKLSVGQKQRVAIARAILKDPAILILDEPTSALDAQSEKNIQESLHTLMQGRTTIVIAHRLSTVREADMIAVFKKGVIVEIGTHSELIQKEQGEYRRLYELQIGLHE